MPTDREAASLQELLGRLEDIEEDLLHSIEVEPELFKLPGVMDATRKLKEAVQCLRNVEAARNVPRVPQYAKARTEFPPRNIVATAIQQLPMPEPGVPPQVRRIDSCDWGLFEVTFVVRPNPQQKSRGWFWEIETSHRVGPGT